MPDDEPLPRYPAKYTFDPEAHAISVTFNGRTPPPYHTQREVSAIIDIADDGTLAAIEIFDTEMPAPKEVPSISLESPNDVDITQYWDDDFGATVLRINSESTNDLDTIEKVIRSMLNGK